MTSLGHFGHDVTEDLNANENTRRTLNANERKILRVCTCFYVNLPHKKATTSKSKSSLIIITAIVNQYNCVIEYLALNCLTNIIIISPTLLIGTKCAASHSDLQVKG